MTSSSTSTSNATTGRRTTTFPFQLKDGALESTRPTISKFHTSVGHRKRNLLQFLHEAGLIVGTNNIIGLIGADLQDAYLEKLDLKDANLEGADMKNADLSETDLRGAILNGADLTDATVTEEQLATCRSVNGVTMPDGSVHD